MKKIALLFCLLFQVLLGTNYPQKSNFDLKKHSLSKSSSDSKHYLEYHSHDNDKYEISLSEGGYFTIGILSGKEKVQADNNCAITYGHPYAKTSYPLFSIDGKWHKVDEYFANTFPKSQDSSLTTQSLLKNNISFKFTIELTSQNNTILKTKIINKDSVQHTIGNGVVLDPALGKGGDGYIKTNNNFLEQKSKLNSRKELTIWEKNKGAKGLCTNIQSLQGNFNQIIVDNWHLANNIKKPELSSNNIQKLFDTVLKFYWSDQELSPGDSIVKTVQVSFPEPDFNSKIFTRSNLPHFFDMNDGAMFPRSFDSYFELIRTKQSTQQTGLINLDTPNSITLDSATYPIDFNGKNIVNKKVHFNTKLCYEDKIVQVTSEITSDGTIIDELSRNIFIPQTPTSDTGLTVYDDSLVTSNYPEVSLIYNVEENATGRKITDLRKENIFLYENGNSIKDFELGHYESEGTQLADIVFVLDCSGSMENEINAVKNNINDFASKLKEQGFNFQIGVITFSTSVDDVWDFTDDLSEIKSNLSSIDLWGGTEDSPSAIMRARNLSWRDKSKRSIIWITDEQYPEDNYTAEDVVDRMLEMGVSVSGIGPDGLQTDWFNPIVNPTGGNFYDITGDFETILLDIADFGRKYRYQLTYESKNTNNTDNKIKLDLRYKGLGTQKNFVYNVPNSTNENIVSIYPNPFNSRVNFKINAQKVSISNISIYNILGQKVDEYSINPIRDFYNLKWTGRNINGQKVSSGTYFIQVSGEYNSGKKLLKTNKIIYLK